MTTLFEKLGGEAAVSAVVDKFYEFMLADPQVSHFFASTDMNKQRCRQKQFITMVTGGPHNYEGTDMHTAHCKFNIQKKDFDVTWKHLEEALLHFSVDMDLVNELKIIFYSVEAEIIKTQTQNSPAQQPLVNSTNKSKASGCPFKAKAPSFETVEEEENKPVKLSNHAYMKLNY